MNCPACLGERFHERELTARISTTTCADCGLVMSDIEPPEVAQSEFARVEPEAYLRSVGRVRQVQATRALELAARHGSGANRTWLDIGCSFGYLLREAQRRGYEVLGTEPDEAACDQARQLLGEDHVHHGLMTDDVVGDETVDVVSMMDVLEHIPAPQLGDFAHMVHRKLRTEGLWLVKVPSTDGLYYKAAHQLTRAVPTLVKGVLERLWQSEYEFPHTVYFNERSLRLLLCRNGFEVVDVEYLEEMPASTVMDRLAMDDSISKRSAYAFWLSAHGVNLVERLRGRSDALLVVARRSTRAGP